VTERLALGLDLSLTASGLCVVQGTPEGPRPFTWVDEQGRTVGSWRTIRRVKDATDLEAMATMAEQVVDYARGWRIERVAIEDVFAPPMRRQEGETQAQAEMRATKQRQNAINLGRLGGMVEYLMWRRGIKPVRYMAMSWRSRVFGGNVGKVAIPLRTYQTYGVEFSTEHECMAFGIGVAALIDMGGAVDRRRTQGKATPKAKAPAAPTLPGIA